MRWVVGGIVAVCVALLVMLWLKSGEDAATPPAGTEPKAAAPERPESSSRRTEPSATRPSLAEPDRPTPEAQKYEHPGRLPPLGGRGEPVSADDPRTRNRVRPTQGRLARRALDEGKFDLALKFAEQELQTRPNKRRARVVGTVAACGIGDRAKAVALAADLPDGPYRRVSRRCKDQFAIDLPERTGDGDN